MPKCTLVDQKRAIRAGLKFYAFHVILLSTKHTVARLYAQGFE